MVAGSAGHGKAYSGGHHSLKCSANAGMIVLMPHRACTLYLNACTGNGHDT